MIRWPTVRSAFLALSGAVLMAGCVSEAPYVFTDYRFHQRGQVIVCYDEKNASPEQVKALADNICAQYDRTSQFQFQQPLQCSWTAPTQVFFTCVARPGEHPAPIQEHLPPMRHDQPLGPQ